MCIVKHGDQEFENPLQALIVRDGAIITIVGIILMASAVYLDNIAPTTARRWAGAS
jgi:hypothetical protein